MRLSDPKRADISLEEALTILAWGVPFTPDDFAFALKFGKCRMDLPALEKRFEELSVERARREAAYSRFKSEYDQAHPSLNHPNNENDIDAELSYHLAEANRSADFAAAARELLEAMSDSTVDVFECATVLDAVRRADLSAREMESASGGITFGCDGFWQSLEVACIHLCNEIKAARVTAMGMSDPDALDWQSIPPAWFNHDPQPHLDFGRNSISRSDGPTGLISRWHHLRFDRRRIEVLRRELLKEADLLPASDASPPPANTSSAKPLSLSPNQEEQIMAVLRAVKPANPKYRPTEKECRDALDKAGIELPREDMRDFMKRLGKMAKSGPRKISA